MYRSSRFLRIIEANLDVLAALPGVEVLASDRHGLDDAMDRLRSRFGADPRFRFVAATDRIDWVAHYNCLLAQGRGEYFAWMPHDDSFPHGYYAGLVDHLDAQPDTLLAFGPMLAIDAQSRELEWFRFAQNPPPWHSPHRWSRRHAYRVLAFHPWVPFRGVFRRDPIVRAGLTLRPTLSNQGADVGWVFGVGLHGPIRFVPVPACVKRFYPESTHRTTMNFSFRSLSSHYAALGRCALRHSPSRLDAVVGMFRLARAYSAEVIVDRTRKRLAVRSRLRRAWRRLTR